jgi:PAS domain S-box-containing protein
MRAHLKLWGRYSIPVLAIGVASLLFLVAQPFQSDFDVVYFGFSVAVLLSAAIAGLYPGLLAASLALLILLPAPMPSAAEKIARLTIFASQGVLLALVGNAIGNARTEDVHVAWTKRYFLSVLFVFTATGLKLAVWRHIECGMPFVFYYLTVAASAWLGGFGPGLLATLLAALSARFFFLDPQYSLVVASPIEELRVGLFIIEGIGISYISGKQITVRQVANRAIHRMRHLAESLLQSTARARALQTLSKDIIWEWDLPASFRNSETANGDSDTASSSFTSWINGIHPGDCLRILGSLTSAVQEGAAEWRGEYRRMFPEKGYMRVSDHAFILRDGGKHPVRVIGRSETHETHETSSPPAGFGENGPYRAVFENNPHAMLLANHGLQVVDANNAACTLLGYARAALTGRGLDDLLSRAARVTILGLSPADPRSVTFEEDCVRATGEVFHARISAAMIDGTRNTSADRVISIEETGQAGLSA